MQQVLENIIDGCKQNSALHQKQLYKYCYVQMMAVCLRYHKSEASAAVSYNTAMHKVLVKINQYKSEGEFLGWVRRIMVTTCLNELKKEVRFTVQELSAQETDVFQASPEIYSHISSKEILQLVQQLPNNTALVFNMYVVEGYTHEQIAVQLQISSGTSKWHMHHARTFLKDKIMKLNNNEHRKNA